VPSAFVTGVTGQDGGYLAELLVAEGSVVHGTFRAGEEIPLHLRALGDALVLHEVDLLDARTLESAVTLAEPDEVYNLGGVSSVGDSWSKPVLTAQVNGVAVAALLELLRRRQQQTGTAVRFVQASTAEIFAGASTSPQSEQTPILPRSPYGAAKAFAHHLVQLFRTGGLHAVNVVLYNHESPRRPPSFVTRKISQGVAAIADGEASELVLGNLESRRDWGWAPEYVAAMVLAARMTHADDYVLATGVGHSVAEFAAAAFAHVGIDDWGSYVRTDPSFARSVDPVDLVGDATKARNVLGWSAQVGFEDLVGRMVDADRRVGRTQSP
jgi:GDPmannose 4,6-dehydratase